MTDASYLIMSAKKFSLVFNAALIVFATVLLYSTFITSFDYLDEDMPSPLLVPRASLILYIIFSIIIFFQDIQKSGVEVLSNDNKSVALTVALILAYLMLMEWAGFLISSIIFSFAYLFAFHYRNVGRLIFISIGLPVLIWWLIVKVFHILLPYSPWFAHWTL